MTTQPDGLELFTVNIAQKMLDRGDKIFVFTGQHLRGKLKTLKLVNACPSTTYRKSNFDVQLEDCVQLDYIPGPRDSARVTDPVNFNFTRKPLLFNIPTRAVSKGFFLRKLENGVWILNIVTSHKG